MNFAALDRRRFLRGAGVALALPWFETFASASRARRGARPRKRFACIYFPDGVPMPLAEDPAFEDWAWFPHGSGTEFRFTKCLEPLEPLRADVTVLSGLSNPAVREFHGHSNADQFLTAAPIGGSGDYRNSISLDQVFAAHVGEETRHASLVMSTDGGTGTPRGAHTLSYDRNGRAIPAEHRPKRIFERLFVQRDGDELRRLERTRSALDDLLADARTLRDDLSGADRRTLEEYLDAVRETERRIQKAERWADVPLPAVDPGALQLEATLDEPRAYLQTMYDLIHLAFQTDTTRVATYQIGRENGVGRSDHLARAVGFPLSHQLSHETKQPDGWKNFGTYCRFLAEEFARFAAKLRATPEQGGEGNLLDNTLLLFGSASSAFHLSRNYPLVLAGGRNMGFRHGRFLDRAGDDAYRGGWDGGTEPWQMEFTREDEPLANLYVTMLQRLGVETDSFADSTGRIDDV